MPSSKTVNADGSAVVEFIVFVLFGQLLVFAGGMQLAQWGRHQAEARTLSASTGKG